MKKKKNLFRYSYRMGVLCSCSSSRTLLVVVITYRTKSERYQGMKKHCTLVVNKNSKVVQYFFFLFLLAFAVPHERIRLELCTKTQTSKELLHKSRVTWRRQIEIDRWKGRQRERFKIFATNKNGYVRRVISESFDVKPQSTA